MIESPAGIGRKFPIGADVADGEEAGGRDQPLDRPSLPRWFLILDHVAIQVAASKLTSATIFGTGGRDPRRRHQVQAVGVAGDTISLLFPLECRSIGEGHRTLQGKLADEWLVAAIGAGSRLLLETRGDQWRQHQHHHCEDHEQKTRK